MTFDAFWARLVGPDTCSSIMAVPIRSPARQEWTTPECQGRGPQESWSTSSQSNRVPRRLAPSWLHVPRPSLLVGGLKGCSRSALAIISNVQPSQQCPEDRRLAHRMPRSVAVPACLLFPWAFFPLSQSAWPLFWSDQVLVCPILEQTPSHQPPKPPNARSLPWASLQQATPLYGRSLPYMP